MQGTKVGHTLKPLELLREFVAMEIPCPYRMNDGRLREWQDWYLRVEAAIARAEGRD